MLFMKNYCLNKGRDLDFWSGIIIFITSRISNGILEGINSVEVLKES